MWRFNSHGNLLAINRKVVLSSLKGFVIVMMFCASALGSAQGPIAPQKGPQDRPTPPKPAAPLKPVTPPAKPVAPPTAPTETVPVDEDVYHLQPEDVVRILVYNEQQAGVDVPVGKDGYISAPFVGMVKVLGKTTGEVETVLVDAYRQKIGIRNPRVSVTIIKYRTLKGSVGGFVNRPGQYEIRPGDTLVSLLNQGGGPVADRADLRRATFRRLNSNELIPVDLYAMLIKGDTSQNYKLEDGDELNIPEETNLRISVQGAVSQPGTYSYKEPMTLADAISLARGEVRQRSKFSEVLIIRELKGQPGQFLRIKADYVKFIRQGDSTQNISLLPGDLIFVPETKTPDLSLIGNIISTFFYAQRLLQNGLAL